MLQANPNLSYRDVQMILAETATKNDPTDPGWTTNKASYTNDGQDVHAVPNQQQVRLWHGQRRGGGRLGQAMVAAA